MSWTSSPTGSARCPRAIGRRSSRTRASRNTWSSRTCSARRERRETWRNCPTSSRARCPSTSRPRPSCSRFAPTRRGAGSWRDLPGSCCGATPWRPCTAPEEPRLPRRLAPAPRCPLRGGAPQRLGCRGPGRGRLLQHFAHGPPSIRQRNARARHAGTLADRRSGLSTVRPGRRTRLHPRPDGPQRARGQWPGGCPETPPPPCAGRAGSESTATGDRSDGLLPGDCRDSALRAPRLAFRRDLVVVADQIEARRSPQLKYHWYGHRAASWWFEEGWAMLHLDGVPLQLASPHFRLTGAHLHRLPGSRGQLTLVSAIESAPSVVWWAFAVGPQCGAMRLSPDGRELIVRDRRFRV